MNKDIVELREVVMKLVPMLTGRGLSVTQRGSQAYVEFDHATHKPKRVNIPNISDNATPEFCRAIQGFIDHEVGHVLFTDHSASPAFMPGAAKLSGRVIQRKHEFTNMVEDTMIERQMCREFPGSRRNLADLRIHFLDKITKPALAQASDDKDFFRMLLIVVLRALAGQEEFEEFMSANKYWDLPLVKAFVGALKPQTKAAFKTITKTAESLQIALEIDSILFPAVPAPVIEDVMPKSVMTTGGETIVITGKNLTRVESVLIDGKSVKFQEVDVRAAAALGTLAAAISGPSLIAITMKHAAGLVGVTVTTEGGSHTLPSCLEFVAPPPSPPQPSEDEDDSDDDGEAGEGAPSESGEGESQDKPNKKAGAGNGIGERDHSEQEGEGEEGDEAGGASAGKRAGGSAADENDDQGGAGAGGDADDDAGADDGESDDAAPGDADDEDASDGDGQDGDEDAGSDGDADQSEDADKGDGEDASSEGVDQDDPDEAGDDGDGASAGDDDADEAAEDGSFGAGDSGDEDDDDADDGSASKKKDKNAGGDSVDIDTGDSDGQTTISDSDSEDNEGGGFGGEGSGKAMFDFEDDDFDDLDISKQVSILITDEAIESMSRADYVVYTREFDRIEPLEVPAGALKKPWVPRLEDEVRQMTGRMAKDIERMLASQSHIIRTPGHRSGRLHGPALHRVVAGDNRLFSRREEHKSKDTAVTLLVDNSGSMTGEKVRTAMVAAYALSATLERVMIKHEILGFTTGSYGHVPQSLLEAMMDEVRKSKVNYSRSEPIVMPIYKTFDERVTAEVKGRIAYMANAQPGLWGNIDGESLEYAAMRLVKRTEKRKVMIVLSDGHPAGGPHSAGHLKRVVEDLNRSGIETIGIGIKDSAVSRFYPKHVVLHNVEELPGQVMRELKAILS